MNNHKELLKIIPQIFNEDLEKEIFEDLMVTNPKSIIDSFKRIKKINFVSDQHRILFKHLRSHYQKSININQYKEIYDLFIADQKIAAIKLLRKITGLGLKEAKESIDLLYS